MEVDDKISVIIPTYNRKEQLKECIHSILEQSYNNIEIVIIDDCSTDDTENFLNKNFSDNRIFYIKNKENSGAGISRKNGYNIATGKYIIFCDDDDYYVDNDFFKNAINILKDDLILMVCSNSYIKYEKENKQILKKLNFENMIDSKKYLENFQLKYSKPNSTFSTVFRKSSLDASNVESMEMMNDSSIYLRALLNDGKIYIYETPTGVYRIHSKNITFNLSAEFIIDNLKEKKYIYEIIDKKNILNNVTRWFEEQILLTIRYFIFGNNPDKEEIKKILKWLKQNYKNYYKINFKIKLFILKKNIKKLLNNKT